MNVSEANKESGSIRLYLEDFTPFLVGSDAMPKSFSEKRKSVLYGKKIWIVYGLVCVV